MSSALGAKYHSHRSQLTLLLCRSPTSFLVHCWLFYLGGEKGDISGLGMEQQQWVNVVFLSYLFIYSASCFMVTSIISDSRLWIYSNPWN